VVAPPGGTGKSSRSIFMSRVRETVLVSATYPSRLIFSV
jgi:hypothetical protein